jgi:lysophospholipase L1-like esterase
VPLRSAALVLAATLCLLVAIEVGVRAVTPAYVDVPHDRIDPAGFYTWEPGARFTYHNLPHVDPPTAPVRINEHGLRGAALPTVKPAGERRVLVLGDSYTSAVQLPEDVIFTTLLERRLQAAAPPGLRYRVVNAGFQGAGTAQELLYYLHRGRALAPDVVVLQIAYNDVDDNVEHGGFHLREGRLELSDRFRRPPGWLGPFLDVRDAIRNRSLAFHLFYKAVRRVARGLVPVAHAADTEPRAPDPDVTLSVRIVERLLAAANADHAPVVVLTIPAPAYVAALHPSYAPFVVALRALVAGTDDQLIAADGLLHDAERAGHPVYLASEWHLNPTGHRIVADALAPAILRSLDGGARR